MASATATQTTTLTITATDVRVVLASMHREALAIFRALPNVPRDFHFDEVWRDVSVLIMHDAISAVSLEVYVQDELRREYRFVICDRARPTSGPSADNPPTGPVPVGARLRLVATRNPRQASQEVDELLTSLGWNLSSRPLKRPSGSTPQAYGTFSSGGFAVQREFWTKG